MKLFVRPASDGEWTYQIQQPGETWPISGDWYGSRQAAVSAGKAHIKRLRKRNKKSGWQEVRL